MILPGITKVVDPKKVSGELILIPDRVSDDAVSGKIHSKVLFWRVSGQIALQGLTLSEIYSIARSTDLIVSAEEVVGLIPNVRGSHAPNWRLEVIFELDGVRVLRGGELIATFTVLSSGLELES